MFDWFYNKKYELPTKESIDNKKNKVMSEVLNKKNQDCITMYNLLNKTLQEAVYSNNNYQYTNIDRTILNSYRNMNISNCDDFENYKKQLDERDIKFVYQENCRTKQISYDSAQKILKVYGL